MIFEALVLICLVFIVVHVAFWIRDRIRDWFL